MERSPEPTKTDIAVADEQLLDTGELRRLAALLDVLMEVDFLVNRSLKETTND